METDTTFPVVVGTVVQLRCQSGFSLKGDSEITCLNGRDYTIINRPICQVISYFCYFWREIIYRYGLRKLPDWDAVEQGRGVEQ